MSNSRVVKNSIFNVANTLLNILLPLVTSVYTSRILMPDGIGTLAYVGTVVSLFASLASLGIPNYGIKIISLTCNDRNELNKAYTELLLLNTIGTFVVSVFFIVYVFFFVKDYKVLYFVLGIPLFLNCINVDWYYGGIERYDTVAIRSFIIKCLSVIAMFLFVRTKEDLIKYAIISAAASALNIVVGFRLAKAKIVFKKLNLKQHIKPILILSLTIIFSTIYSKIDIIMLKHMVGENWVGIYSNAHKIVNIITSVCTAITAVFLPRISYLYKNDRKEFDALIAKGLEFLYFITIPACTGLLFLAKDLTQVLYGEAFAASASAMMILSLLIVIQGIGGLTNYQVVICAGKESVFIPTTIISMLINISVNWLLIPRYNAVGAAVASVLGELFLNVALFIYIHKTVGFKVRALTLVKCLIADAVMVGAIFAVKWIEMSSLPHCILVVTVGAAAYVLVSMVLKNNVLNTLTKAIKERAGAKH